MDDRTKKAKSRRHGERARYRQKLVELEEAEARNRRLIGELRKSGELFSSIADSATDAIIALNEQGTIYFMNRAAEHLFGYTSVEVEGRLLHDFLIPERFREYSLKSFELMHEIHGKSVMGTTREFTALTKQGKELPVEVSISSYDMEGKTHYVTICRDISERKKVEQALRESEERYRQLVENLNDVVFNLDSLGRISYISPAIESISSYKPEDLVGQSFTHFIHPDDMPDALEDFKLTLAGRLEPAEFRVLDKDGTVLHIRTSSRPQYKDGELIGLTGVLTDITERKEAERELDAYRARLEELVEKRTKTLKESEEMYKTLVLISPDAVTMSDLEGNITYASPQTLLLHGYENEDELLGKSSFDLISREDHDKAMSTIAAILQQGFARGIEGTFLRKDGTSFTGELSAALIRDANGDPHSIVAFTRNITERKQAEQELRDSEERYRSLIETSPDCVILADLTGKVLMVNPSGTTLFGYENEEDVLGMDLLEFLAPEERRKVTEVMKDKNMAKRRSVTGEYTMVRRDGSRFSGEVVASLVRDAQGKPVGFLGISRDITDRKQAVERLRRLNESFLGLGADPLENMQKLARTCTDILNAFLVRYGRREKGKFYFFSSLQADDGFVEQETAEEYACYHVSSSDLSGILTEEDLEDGIFERDPDVRRYGLKSGLFYPVRMHGENIGNLCVFAREKRVFDQVEKDTLATLGRAISIEEERRAFNESLRDFVDIASHELRHPVALLAGYAETLEEHGAEMDEQTRSEVASAIRYGTDRLNRLVVGLLNISLVERERFFISKHRQDIVSLVEQAAGEMRVRVPARRFNVSASQEVVEGDIDPVRIHSLLIILLDNAVKYSPQNTDIDVTVEATREEILVSVLDRGIGVSSEHVDKIFERFYQVEEAQYHSKPGLGLGLFLARQIVEGHGGTIWYEQREGGGAAFRFTLPLR